MSREIKFRGKRVDNGEWVYGFLYSDEFKSFILKQEIIQICPNTVNGPEEYENEIIWIEVIQGTVGQYTGLKDKNGTEIYEGDIVQWNHYKGKRNAEIKYSQTSASFWTVGYLDTFFYKKDSLEVIGNIHENPELLK